MKKIIKYALCLLIGLLVLLPVNSFAKESRLHDETGQLSNDEYSQILTMLDAYSQQHEIDICVNVVNDTDGYSIDDYANDKFDEYQYGYDDNYSCILLTIDMGSRQYYHTTDIDGKGFNYITDYSIDNLGNIFAQNYGQNGLFTALQQWIYEVDRILTSAEKGDIIDIELADVIINVQCDEYVTIGYDVYNFSGEFIKYVNCSTGNNIIQLPAGQGYVFYCDDITDGFKKPEEMQVYVNNSYNVTVEKNPFYYLGKTGIAAAVSAVIAAIYSAIVAGKNKSVSYKYDASQYLNNDSVKYNAVHDNFLYRNVIKTPKPKSDDNDHNHSSSSFGGSSFSGSVSSHSGGRSGGSF
ncbi:MAG: TPM domain-containing protein [Erysipelotrichaceae bacterium]|nr:TPM domain-containing protein [Erysipelotrichaceae bacterium]